MFDIQKTAATVAAAATVVATGVAYIIHRRETEMTQIEEDIKNFYSPEFIAFTLAQDVVSERLMRGYYDDITNEAMQADYNVIYANFLKK